MRARRPPGWWLPATAAVWMAHSKGLEALAAALGPTLAAEDADGVDMGAKNAPVPVVPAVAGLAPVVDRVGLAAGHRGDQVGPGAGPLDLAAALAVECQGAEFAGVAGGVPRYSGRYGHGA